MLPILLQLMCVLFFFSHLLICRPILPIVGKGADKKSEVSKAQMFESVYTGAPAPKTKPKPRGKDTRNIELSGNTAYEKWKMN